MIYRIVLTVSLLMSGSVPDIEHAADVDTIEHCWAQAATFLAKPMPHVEGAEGLAATCSIVIDNDDQ